MVDIWNNLGNFFGKMGGMGVDPDTAAQSAPLDAAYGGGSADTGGGPMPAAASSPTPQPSSGTSPLETSQYSNGQQTLGKQSMPQSVLQAMLDANNPKSHVLDAGPGIAQIAQLMGQRPDYLSMVKQGYQNTLNQIHGVQDDVNNRYNQAATDTRDLFQADSNAAKLGDGNVLQAIANDQGKAIQGTADNAAQAMAALKNAQLAQYKTGNTPLGDRVSDPTMVQQAGLVANAQQAANNAQSQAASRTQLNNEMADAMLAQGGVMNSQLLNQQTNYNASMGKYLADLANQESQREMQAAGQNWQQALGAIQAGWGMAKDSAGLDIQRQQAVNGSRGLDQVLADIGSYNMDNAHSADYLNQATGANGASPMQAAISYYQQADPQNAQGLANAYNSALSHMQLQQGTKPTWNDIAQAMYQQNTGLPGAELNDFAQRADASKAMGGAGMDPSILDSLMQQMG